MHSLFQTEGNLIGLSSEANAIERLALQPAHRLLDKEVRLPNDIEKNRSAIANHHDVARFCSALWKRAHGVKSRLAQGFGQVNAVSNSGEGMVRDDQHVGLVAPAALVEGRQHSTKVLVRRT